MIKDVLFKELKKIKIKDKRIAIQIPEGLKQYSTEILDYFKDNNPVLFVDPCYGACDTKDKEAKEMGATLLIHFGHEGMGSQIIKTLYVPLKYEIKNSEIRYIIDGIKKLKFKKINLVTTTQYLDAISGIKQELAKNKIIVCKGKETNRVKENMVLGCDASTIIDKTSPIVFIGDGAFHVNNLAFLYSTQKIFAISPILKETKEIKINDEFIRKRYAMVGIARTKTKFGILVSSKDGQKRLELAYEIKKYLEKNKKQAYVLVSDYIKEDYLVGVNIECYINTACPRITYDDSSSFRKPIISASEGLTLFDKEKEIKIDQIN